MDKYHDGKYYYYSYEKSLSTIVSKITEIKQNYNYLTSRYDEVEKAHQDLLHYIEFSNLNVVEGFKVLKRLKEIRIERRLLKDELNEAKIAHDLIDNMVVEQITNQLKDGQSKCKKAELSFDKKYTPRNLGLSKIPKEKFELAQEKYNEELKNEIVVKK